MTCRHITDTLSSGRDLNVDERQHADACNSCSRLLSAFPGETPAPDAQVLASIRLLLATQVLPVRPLPGNNRLALGIFISFVALSVFIAAVSGFGGFKKLSWSQMIPYYGLLLLVSGLFARTSVSCLVPGSRSPLTPVATIGLSISAIVGVTIFAFPWFVPDGFVATGLPCLYLGCFCALVAVVPVVYWANRGYVTQPVAAAAFIGSFAGLVGVAVLALHCLIHNSVHIIVWHLAPVGIAALSGAIYVTIRLRRADNMRQFGTK